MSTEISTAFVQTYSTNVAMLLQQSGSRFRDAVTQNSFVGKAASMVEQFGSVNAVRNLGRHADTPLISTPQDKRWIHPNDHVWADLIDDVDKLRMLIDPTSPYAKAGANALGRAIDDEILWGFFNSNLTGENGTSATGLLSAYNTASQVVASTVGASAATGLNVAKLRAAKKILMASDLDVDNEQLFIGVTAAQHDNLLGETQTTNADYTDKPALIEGRIRSFMGFNFIISERIPGGANYNTGINGSVTGYTTGSLWLLPVWAKSGMALGVWNDIETSIDKRADKLNSTQVMVKGTFGGARTEENRCAIITCA